MHAVPHGLPEDRPQFNLSKYFQVIKKEPSTKDESINDRIQKEGAHVWGGGNEQPLTGGEAEWYRNHKGYSKKIGSEGLEPPNLLDVSQML